MTDSGINKYIIDWPLAHCLKLTLSFLFCSDVYSLCVAHPEPFTTELYNETKAFLKKHVLDLRNELDKHENNSTLLKVYYDVWSKYSQGIGFLNQLYW